MAILYYAMKQYFWFGMVFTPEARPGAPCFLYFGLG